MLKNKRSYVTTAFISVVLLTGIPSYRAQAKKAPESDVPSAIISEDELVKLVSAQNKTLPIMSSEHLRLTKIVAGPGLKITYQVQVVADAQEIENVIGADHKLLKEDTLKESCDSLKFGLKSGITYLMSYTAPDGSKLLDLSITREDCGF